MGGSMNGLDKIGAEIEQLDPIRAQHTGLKPPGAMRDQIELSADFDASLDELFDGAVQPARCNQP